MNLQIRKSSFGDYIAVDDVDDAGNIISSPFYIKRNESVNAYVKDQELNKYVLCEITMTAAGHLVAVDIDSESEFNGLTWTVDPAELTTNNYKFIKEKQG